MHELSYTTRKHQAVEVANVTSIEEKAGSKSVLLVHHETSKVPLQFDVGILFRDPLVDLLTLLLTGKPQPLPDQTAITAARRGSDLSLKLHRLDTAKQLPGLERTSPGRKMFSHEDHDDSDFGED